MTPNRSRWIAAAATDLAVGLALRAYGLDPATALLGAWLASVLTVVTLSGCSGALLLACLFSIPLRSAALLLAQGAGLPEALTWIPATAIGIATAAGAVHVLTRDPAQALRWRASGLTLWLLALRVLHAPLLELLPEEAYYWNYAKHPDWSYFDHPPLTAWLIMVSRWVFGDTEFAVRLPAVGCGLALLWFIFRQTRELYDESTAWVAVALAACLPYVFGTSLLMSPDTPLATCWAAALYCLQRAVLQGKGRAWLGLGLAIGLGLLSKYTIALLGGVAVALLILDPAARRWWRSPWPYGGLVICCLVFTPVVWWNYTHDWASFRFQSGGRWAGTSSFHLHDLALHILALAGPLVPLVIGCWWQRTGMALTDAARRRFLSLAAVVPLAIFVWYALRHEPRLNWTGPIWLALIAPAAALLLHARSGVAARLGRGLAIVVCVGVTLGCQYLTLGLPWVPIPEKLVRVAGWEDLGRQVAELQRGEETRLGHRVFIVGLDKYNLASELAFYLQRHGDGQRSGSADAVAGYLFGGNGLMYRWWFPAVELSGHDLLLVAKRAKDLESTTISANVQRLGPVVTLEVRARSGAVVGRYFVRSAEGYRAPEFLVPGERDDDGP